MRKHFHKFLPTREVILKNQYLNRFAHLLHHHELWHLHRRSLAGGLALGIFIESTPVLGHIPLFLLLALWLRVNIPAGIAANMIVNPVTMAPYFYFSYRLGEFTVEALHLPIRVPDAPPNIVLLFQDWQAFFSQGSHQLGAAYLVLWVGCLIVGTLAALTLYYGTLGLWRLAVIYRWRHRHKKNH